MFAVLKVVYDLLRMVVGGGVAFIALLDPVILTPSTTLSSFVACTSPTALLIRYWLGSPRISRTELTHVGCVLPFSEPTSVLYGVL